MSMNPVLKDGNVAAILIVDQLLSCPILLYHFVLIIHVTIFNVNVMDFLFKAFGELDHWLLLNKYHRFF